VWFQFWKRKSARPSHTLAEAKWLLAPLGNPGAEYAATRHNLGRLMLQRWIDGNCPKAELVQQCSYFSAYSLTDGLVALVPSTFMNLSGKGLKEAKGKGYPIGRLVALCDDKDLPLGTGRLSKSGGSAGHNGIQSIMDELGTDSFLRLRLGIGPFRRPLREWVLEEWADGEWEIIEKMDRPFFKAMELLASGESADYLQAQINQQKFWEQ
jgi:PTH1 family peptidyl-tRNA hydrolase